MVVRGIERFEDLRLQARLLVEADLEVREQGELCAPGRVVLEPRLLVVGEGLAQETLALGRVAGPEAGEGRPVVVE